MQTTNPTPPVPYAEVDAIFTCVGITIGYLENSPLPQAERWTTTLNAVVDSLNDTLNAWADNPACLPPEFLDDPAKMFGLSAIFTAADLAAATGAPPPGLTFDTSATGRAREHHITAAALTQIVRTLGPALPRLSALTIPEAKDWFDQIEPVIKEANDALATTGFSLSALSVQSPAYTFADMAALTDLRGNTVISDALDVFRAAAKDALEGK